VSIGGYGLAALALVAALFGAWLTVRKVGKLTVERDQAEQSVDAARTRIEVGDANRRRSDADLRDRLRRKPP